MLDGLAGLDRPRLRVRTAHGGVAEAPLAGPGPVGVGPLTVDVWESDGGWAWSVANAGDAPVDVVSIGLVWDSGLTAGDRFFRHGYQSWSPTGTAVVGRDTDPSTTPGARSLVRAMHHADHERVPDRHELRSELVTVVAAGAGDRPPVLVGFDGGAGHDGTFRLRPATGGRRERWELTAEAYLGGCRLVAGERRPLHGVSTAEGDDVPSLLDTWAARTGAGAGARTNAAYQVGWCSWYQWFHAVDEAAVRRTLDLAAGWPFTVFQVDDGYQRAIGDWLATAPTFPSGVDGVAAAIGGAGYTPGIWLAPFLVAPGSDVAGGHPGWRAAWGTGDEPLVGSVNAAWGGVVHVLDTTRPEVQAHLEAVAAGLVAAGHRYLKLDFTYAPALPGRYADPSLTPAQRVRAGLDAIRRGAGDEVFLLGCGLPLGPAVGVVDGMRIGPDVAPWWEAPAAGEGGAAAGYEGALPATANAWRNTLARSFQHRRLWLNDPDCLMLRTTDTRMSAPAVRAWALAVAASGGMAIASDDLALVDADGRALLDEVVARGREVDAATARGPAPRAEDLLVADPPTRLSSGAVCLEGDPAAPAAMLVTVADGE